MIECKYEFSRTNREIARHWIFNWLLWQWHDHGSSPLDVVSCGRHWSFCKSDTCSYYPTLSGPYQQWGVASVSEYIKMHGVMHWGDRQYYELYPLVTNVSYTGDNRNRVTRRPLKPIRNSKTVPQSEVDCDLISRECLCCRRKEGDRDYIDTPLYLLWLNKQLTSYLSGKFTQIR